METQKVDSLLIELLNGISCYSKLRTCLLIRLSDLAAQLCGYRSSRQIDESQSEIVEEQFNTLVDDLFYYIKESEEFLKTSHTYKKCVYNMGEDTIELLLEDTLFDMVSYNRRHIFVENFFIN